MKQSILLIVFVILASAILIGCAPASTDTPVPPVTPPINSPAANTPGPASTAAGAKVNIYYEENAQVELISPAGSRVLIDVYAPDLLSSPATAKDVLLTTHTDNDHIKTDFYKSFPGQQLFTKVGNIKLPDVTIQGIASSHISSSTPQPENGTNYIFLIEMGSLRIAHFGDIGQDALTADQLTTLGKVDIAITQLANLYSQMDDVNKKGFSLMDQVKPRLIIPTHNYHSMAKDEGKKWPTLYSDQKFVSIGRGDLTDETRLLYLGTSAETFAKAANAVKVDW